MWRKLVFLVCCLVCLVSAAFAQTGEEVVVNGNPLLPGAVLGSTGSDMAVMASPFFEAAGAQVRVSGTHLEALWIDLKVELNAGSNLCVVNGRNITLSTPCGSLDSDLVLPAGEVARALGAKVDSTANGITIWKDNEISDGSTPVVSGDTAAPVAAGGVATGNPNPAGASYPPGFALLQSSGMAGFGAIPGTGGLPAAPPEAITGRPFPEAGMGGLTSKTDEYNSPYERPGVSASSIGGREYTVQVPRTPDEIFAAARQNQLSGAGGAYAQTGQNVSPYGTPNVAPASSYSVPQQYGAAGMPAVANPAAANPAAQVPGSGDNIASTSKVTYSQVQTPDNGLYSSSAPVTAAVEPGRKGAKQPVPKPAKASIVSLDARRVMTFHLTTYEISAKVKNEGQLAFSKPFVLQLLAKSKGYNRYELLESYLIQQLQPGQEVEVTKTVDGHQFPTLLDLNVTFKVLVLEEQPPKPVNGRYSQQRTSTSRKEPQAKPKARPGQITEASSPGMVEGDSREKSLSF